MAKRSIFLILTLFLAALGVWAVLPGRVALARSSDTYSPGNVMLASSTPRATSTPTALVTKTNQPTAQTTPAVFLTPDIIVEVSGYSVNLRTGPGRVYPKVQLLDFGEKLTLLGSLKDYTWINVKTSAGQEGWLQTKFVDHSGIYLSSRPIQTPPPTPIPTPEALPGVKGRWIDIDITDQTLYAFEDDQVVGAFLVSTGVAQFPTVTGQYNIYDKLRFHDMRGPGYNLPDVPFTMHYDGSFSIHGTYWHHNFGTPMSHGCINMDTKDAEWLYNWASVGTMVNIHW